jgi:HprK-related kinase A
LNRIASPPDPALRERLRGAGLRLRVAGLCINIRIDVPAAIGTFLDMYAGHRFEPGTGVDDFRVHLTYTKALRRLARSNTEIVVDGKANFEALPARNAYVSIETGLNWCIVATTSHVALHAAVVERDGLAVLLPAASGSGKSTLCAALVMRGWRLFSDETALFHPEDGRLQPVARPISLKNQSIEVIRRWAPEGHFSPLFAGMTRGDYAYLRPPADALARLDTSAAPALIVSPAYQTDVPATLEPLARSEVFRLLSQNAMNHHLMQRAGFEAVARVVETCPAYRLWFSSLAEAVDAIDALLARTRAERGDAAAR